MKRLTLKPRGPSSETEARQMLRGLVEGGSPSGIGGRGWNCRETPRSQRKTKTRVLVPREAGFVYLSSPDLDLGSLYQPLLHSVLLENK